MSSSANPEAGEAVRARLLQQLRQRLETAHEWAAAVQEHLKRGDPAAIDRATARVETLSQEVKVLAEELDRLGLTHSDGPDVARERAALEQTAARLARSSAISGGLLERMLAVSRGLLGLFAVTRDGTYSSTGRAHELAQPGARLLERI